MKKLNIIVLFIISLTTTAQEPVGGSIFPYNTCIEPCWMGITPGISTSLDVDDMLKNFSNIVTIEEYGKSISRSENGEWAVDEDTGIVQSGGYTFDVLTPSSQFSIITSRIEIQNGLIDLMMILGSQEYDISLATILNKLGEPDHIRMYSTDDFDTSQFRLIYTDALTTINLYQTSTICQTDTLPDSFSLLNIFLHSEQSASKAWKSIDSTLYQPALIRYVFDTERDVPHDIWEQWISGEITETCYEAWEKLTPPDLEAIAITPTPAIEVTSEPTP